MAEVEGLGVEAEEGSEATGKDGRHGVQRGVQEEFVAEIYYVQSNLDLFSKPFPCKLLQQNLVLKRLTM